MAKTSDKTNDTRSEPEGADGEEGKAAPAKRKLSLKLIIIAIGGLVGFGAIGGGGYYFLFAGHGKAEAAATAEAPPVTTTAIGIRRFTADLDRSVAAGQDLLERLTRIVVAGGAARPKAPAAAVTRAARPVAETPRGAQAVAAAAQAFAERLRIKVHGLAA